jgi:hypothetical protein
MYESSRSNRRTVAFAAQICDLRCRRGSPRRSFEVASGLLAGLARGQRALGLLAQTLAGLARGWASGRRLHASKTSMKPGNIPRAGDGNRTRMTSLEERPTRTSLNPVEPSWPVRALSWTSGNCAERWRSRGCRGVGHFRVQIWGCAIRERFDGRVPRSAAISDTRTRRSGMCVLGHVDDVSVRMRPITDALPSV